MQRSISVVNGLVTDQKTLVLLEGDQLIVVQMSDWRNMCKQNDMTSRVNGKRDEVLVSSQDATVAMMLYKKGCCEE